MHHNLELIREYLILNREHILEKLKPLFEQRLELLKDSSLFKKEIEDQFLYMCKALIKTECGKDLGCSIEDITITIERININVYLGLEQ